MVGLQALCDDGERDVCAVDAGDTEEEFVPHLDFLRVIMYYL